MRKRLAILLSASLLLAACGGDDDSGSADSDKPGTEPAQAQPEQDQKAGEDVTREEYIARADKHCEGSNARSKRLNERTQKAVESESDDRARLEALVPILREGLEIQTKDLAAFRAIAPPAEDRDEIDALFAAYDDRQDGIKKLLVVAEAGDVQGFAQAAKEQERAKLRARELAQDYGFKECGSGKSEAGPTDAN